jgi:pimeloyl-ACP methyl ester carboxylesterase
MPEAPSRMLRSLRSDHAWRGPRGVWTFDCWGHVGRPVLLLHGPTLDRSAWWPVAAELATNHLVVAVDLPGHGESPPRPSYEPIALVEELAELLHFLDARRAPIVVGHAESALLATMFAAAFTTHAVVNVEQRLDLRRAVARIPTAIRGERLQTVPQEYRSLVVPKTDASDYVHWTSGPGVGHVDAQLAGTLRKIRAPYLGVFGELPWPEYPTWLATLIPRSRCISYQVHGPFPYLVDLDRFVNDLRSLD